MEKIIFSELDNSWINAICSLELICFKQPWNKKQYAEAFLQNNFSVWGLLLNNALLAYLSAFVISNEMEIINFAVHPEYRKLGFGKTLFGRVLQAADKMGIDKMFLEVRQSNVQAIKIYENFGFTRCGLRKTYYPDTKEDALLYLRERFI